MRNFTIFLIVISVIFCLNSISHASNEYQVRLIKKFYSMGTATINGTYYPVGNSIARLFSVKMKNLVAIAEPTAGSLANIEYLRRGQIDLALVQSDVAWMAFNGAHNFTGNRFTELRILASLYSEVIQIIVRADSTIKTIEDLKGKKIAVGEKDSGSAASVMLVLGAAGLKPEDYTFVYERFTRATESLNDGYVDAVYYAGAVPADGISRLASKTPLRLVSVPAEVGKKLVAEYPYFSVEQIPEKSYQGQETPVQTVGFRALLAGTESLPRDEVLSMLQVIYDNPEMISDQNKIIIRPDIANGISGVAEEMLHPGAKRFFSLRQKK